MKSVLDTNSHSCESSSGTRSSRIHLSRGMVGGRLFICFYFKIYLFA